ncbi:hypothetical protein J6590_085477 [Homalodisca vitripennis]|nr:hypothetical protein J6590_085477 [Homalodisca vitripennis]
MKSRLHELNSMATHRFRLRSWNTATWRPYLLHDNAITRSLRCGSKICGSGEIRSHLLNDTAITRSLRCGSKMCGSGEMGLDKWLASHVLQDTAINRSLRGGSKLCGCGEIVLLTNGWHNLTHCSYFELPTRILEPYNLAVDTSYMTPQLLGDCEVVLRYGVMRSQLLNDNAITMRLRGGSKICGTGEINPGTISPSVDSSYMTPQLLGDCEVVLRYGVMNPGTISPSVDSSYMTPQLLGDCEVVLRYGVMNPGTISPSVDSSYMTPQLLGDCEVVLRYGVLPSKVMSCIGMVWRETPSTDTAQVY